MVIKLVCVAVCLLGLATPAWAYIDASPTLGRIVKESTSIVVLQVEKVSQEKGVVIYKKVEDLEGEHPTGQIKHQITAGWHLGESKLGQIGPDAKASLPALMAALEDKDAGVRNAVAAAVEKIERKIGL